MLDAASLVFGERGYAGATTDAVAKAAGVSQAYVVRTFGSKDALFAATATRACDRVAATFRGAAHTTDGNGADGSDDTATASMLPLQERLGLAYLDLVKDRGTLLTVMHLFTLGHHERFGPLARDGFLTIHRILRQEVGLSAEEAEHFLAKGMLINTVMGLRLPDVAGAEPAASELLSCIFDEDAEEIVELTAGQDPLGPASRGTW